MNFRVLSVARQELKQAVSYYNEEQPGLGHEFAAEVKRAFERIAEHPLAWHPLSTNTRRCRLNRFPYAVIYHYRPEGILVLAIMHLKRHPDSWRGRTGS